MSDAVAEKVISTLASVKRIPADTITLETNLQDLGIDSLDVFTLLFELENAFKISIPDDDVRSLRTVNDVVDGIKKILAAAPPDTSLGSATPGGLTNGPAPRRHHRFGNYFSAGIEPRRKLEIPPAKAAPPLVRSSRCRLLHAAI